VSVYTKDRKSLLFVSMKQNINNLSE